uniref:Uncharacterized protein n=1 Tax=Rhizophora mucronata TaxID=61149 RepID=A0A2P2QAF7_RHIMU
MPLCVSECLYPHVYFLCITKWHKCKIKTNPNPILRSISHIITST